MQKSGKTIVSLKYCKNKVKNLQLDETFVLNIVSRNQGEERCLLCSPVRDICRDGGRGWRVRSVNFIFWKIFPSISSN